LFQTLSADAYPELTLLIEASGEKSKDIIEEYKVRRQIETMFGCLKSRGFNLEETHLTKPEKIRKLLMLLGLSLAILSRVFKLTSPTGSKLS
jgi:transposase